MLKNDEDYLPKYVYDASLDQLYNIPVASRSTEKHELDTYRQKWLVCTGSQGEFILGDIDFGSVMLEKAFVETAYGGTPPAGLLMFS